MSTSPCSVTAEEGYQTCAPASNQPEISITHIYTTNPDASDSSPVELSAAAKALMLQLAIQRQQQQAMQEGGSTRILRSSCRQQKRLRHFSFKEVRIPAKKRRQENASYPLVCASLFSFSFLCSPPFPRPPKSRTKGQKNLFNEGGCNEFKKIKKLNGLMCHH